MDGNLVIEKLIDVSNLDLKDAKARRLFILADGKRTVDELYNLCNLKKESGDEILQLLLDGKYANFVGSSSGTTSSAGQSKDTGNSFTLTANFIAKLTNEMTGYIGPIASILVNNIVSTDQTCTMKGVEEILTTLSDSIEGKDEREKFLIKMKNSLS